MSEIIHESHRELLNSIRLKAEDDDEAVSIKKFKVALIEKLTEKINDNPERILHINSKVNHQQYNVEPLEQDVEDIQIDT